MADPTPAAPPSYPNVPMPPAGPPVAYPPQGYPGWQGAPPAQYRGPILPPWISFGSILVVVGGILILVGFMIDLVGIAANFTSTSANAPQNYATSMEAFAALVGVGIFVAVLGWFFHQMSVYRRSGH